MFSTLSLSVLLLAAQVLVSNASPAPYVELVPKWDTTCKTTTGATTTTKQYTKTITTHYLTTETCPTTILTTKTITKSILTTETCPTTFTKTKTISSNVLTTETCPTTILTTKTITKSFLKTKTIPTTYTTTKKTTKTITTVICETSTITSSILTTETCPTTFTKTKTTTSSFLKTKTIPTYILTTKTITKTFLKTKTIPTTFLRTKTTTSSFLKTKTIPTTITTTKKYTKTIPVTLTSCSAVPPPCEGGTAYGLGDCCSTPLNTLNYDTCNHWGWYIKGTSTTTFPITGTLWVGAGLNDISKGTKAGSFTITQSGNSYTVTYDILAGFHLDEVHIYASCSKPTACAPGGFTADEVPKTFTLDCYGDVVYFILHAKVSCT